MEIKELFTDGVSFEDAPIASLGVNGVGEALGNAMREREEQGGA